MTSQGTSSSVIEVRIRELAQLFNSLDPSPFHERDLDDDAEGYIVSWARELPDEVPFHIVVNLPQEEARKAQERGLEKSFANYFAKRASMIDRDLKELFRTGRRYLSVGVPVLILCLVVSQLARSSLGAGPLARAVEESFIIVGWVANRKPIAAAAVLIFGFNRHTNAGDSYLDAMAACQEAAASAENPTDYRCDWKKVIDGASGSALTGKFSFREKGMSGEMTILEPGDGPAVIGISTVTDNENTPTCSSGFGASRNDKDELVATMDDPASCEVRIVSVPGPSIVKVTATEGCSTFCGMGAAFTGEWQLQTK